MQKILIVVASLHPLPATEWQLVNRWDSSEYIRLLYRLRPRLQDGAEHNGCLIAVVALNRSGSSWRISEVSRN